MGLRPTHGDESQKRRRPRVSGDPRRVDSRFRGIDVTFERVKRGISLCVGEASEVARHPSLITRHFFGGSHSSMRLPSGSMIQAKRPYS